MAGEQLLIVDDNPINLKLARLILDAEGYQIETASGAAEALAALERLAPALILMDLQLGKQDAEAILGANLERLLRQ